MRTGAHGGNPQRNEAIAKGGIFPGGKSKTHVGQKESQGADQLDKMAIGNRKARFIPTRGRPKTGKGDRKLGLPTGPQEVVRMEGDEITLDPPIVQSQKGSDPQAAESRRSPLSGVSSRQR